MPRKKSTTTDDANKKSHTGNNPENDKKDALLFAATLVADELQQEKALGKLKEHIKLKTHVSELEAEKIIQHVHKIQTETPDLENTQSTPDKLLTFLRSKLDKSSTPLLEKGAKGPARKKPKV